MFWYGWNSWVVEIMGGAALGAVCGLIVGDYGLAAAIVAELIYEFCFDENRGKPTHRPWADLGQRTIGVLIGYFAWRTFV